MNYKATKTGAGIEFGLCSRNMQLANFAFDKVIKEMKHLLWIFLIVCISCSPPSIGNNNQSSEPTSNVSANGYILSISEVDNSVNVYVEDSLIFASGTIHSSPEVDFKIDLSPFVKDGSEKLKIELYNGVEPYEPQVDPLWELRYDLIVNGEIVDFVHEFGDDNGIGKVYENTYILGEWAEVKN